jgi:hypothetical protein
LFRNSRLCSTVVVGLLALSLALAQGVATRGVKPAPRAQPSGKPFPAKFVDVASEAGLQSPVIYGRNDRKDYILEAIGGGVAFLDYNADGWLDILVLSGSRLDEASPEVTNRLYRNEKNGRFTDVTKEAGLTRNGWASSVTVADYDNDGWSDLFITYFGQNVLYRNRGDGTFADVTRAAALSVPATPWHSGATWIDYDADGFVDLFVATYLDFDLARVPKAGVDPACNWKGIPVNCGPRGLPASGHKLYRNLGNGKFEDVSARSGIGAVRGSYAMTAVVGDYDSDGRQDIYVACDSTPSYLFRNNGDGTFTEEALERGAALSEDGQEQAGMGVATGDYDLDGDIDIYKTHFADDTDVLYRNDGAGNFEDVTIPAGLAVETRYIRWGAGMADFDHDGLPDLFTVTGSVYPEIETRLPAYPFKGPRLIFRSLGKGRFEELIEEAGPGIAAPHSSRGAAFGDFDNDGDLDIVVSNLGEPPSLLRNDLPRESGNWLQVQLTGTRSNRSAIGARVTVKHAAGRQAQEVTAQSSFYSCNSHRLHFGLGRASQVEVTVRWPSGRVETQSASVNQVLKLVEKNTD